MRVVQLGVVGGVFDAPAAFGQGGISDVDAVVPVVGGDEVAGVVVQVCAEEGERARDGALPYFGRFARVEDDPGTGVERRKVEVSYSVL